MVSIHDVARASGVSPATVSRALRGLAYVSDATRARVRSAADELGYVPSSVASGLVTGLSMTVAVVVPFLGRWYYTTVIQGVDDVLRPAGYDMLVLNLGDSNGTRERDFHHAMLRRRVDAMIVLAFNCTPGELAQLNSAPVPAIAVGGDVDGMRSLGVDDREATTLAVRHLLDLGHRRIAHVGGDDPVGLNAHVPQERQSRWREVLQEAGVSPAADWFVNGGFVLERAFPAALELLRDPGHRPTAVFAGSDEMAFGVILAARELGLRVPEDLSVVGIDDHDFSATFGLTTVRQDPVDQGRRAALEVLDVLRGLPLVRSRTTASCELVVRRTTAPPPPA
ncbi:LacI family DNA-binding transcriptional regulator [Cellulomonas sp. McL0617]|uniref:LacI family DNA-binding transcriptional regulator n=1 Tax=Cellulomonas sp. McL0617 TaxID=3415675 RepID=UPI003CEE80A7